MSQKSDKETYRAKIQSMPPPTQREFARKSAFPKPELQTHKGFLDVRKSSKKDWHRRYFVLTVNFLLSAATPMAEELERVIPLEGTNIRTSTQTTDLTFQLIVRRKKWYFKAPNQTECKQWTEKIEKASKLKIKDIYRFCIHILCLFLFLVCLCLYCVLCHDSAYKMTKNKTQNVFCTKKTRQHICVFF